MKEAERKEIYLNRIMKYLTFLDYTTLKNSNRSIEARLEEKDRTITHLLQDNQENKDAFLQLSDMVMKMSKELQELKEQRK
jgi:hypothetical protein